ncbi:MAG TPA: MBL fold metallo-hydrolase, partial [Candidatus Sulfomarinibacteraceae bacterium]|nr:MBL fold metallo-hydrolase [Candidatus Sulfomarinibacteraceae bacterium]
MTAAVSGGRVRFPDAASGQWELAVELDGHRIAGSSVAALATAFAVERFRAAVDMGRCSALLAAQDTVLLTHCHSDHVAGLVAWLSAHTRRHRGRPTRVVVPEERRDQLLTALEIWPDLDGVRRRVDLDAALLPAAPGTTVELAD